MKNYKLITYFFVIFFFQLLSIEKSQAIQGWSFNIANNNPPGATIGLNFMYLWSKVAFEIGVGSAKVNDTSNNSAQVNLLAGQLDLKYLFGSGGFRPYAQIGTGYSTSSSSSNSNTTAGLSAGGSLYGGIGFFGLGNSVYGYASINIGNAGSNSTFTQFGIGFEI